MYFQQECAIIDIMDHKEGVENMEQTDIQFRAQLIDEYVRLKKAKEMAVKENAVETVKILEEEMNYLKIKLQPTELPD